MEAMDQIRNVHKLMGKNGDAVRKSAREKVWGYIAAALGLVAGLAWNEAIKGLIDHYFPIQGDSVWAKVWYAVILTAVVVFVMVRFEKFFKAEDGNKQEEKRTAGSAGSLEA